MVVCLERGADLHMAQQMPLQLTVFCFIKIQIGFTFLVPAHLGSSGKRAVKRACVHVHTYCSQYECMHCNNELTFVLVGFTRMCLALMLLICSWNEATMAAFWHDQVKPIRVISHYL